jgi:hypothetical protein
MHEWWGQDSDVEGATSNIIFVVVFMPRFCCPCFPMANSTPTLRYELLHDKTSVPSGNDPSLILVPRLDVKESKTPYRAMWDSSGDNAMYLYRR